MDLQLVPIDDLVKELTNRFDHAVFMGIKVESNDPKATAGIYSCREWVGNSYTCAGLAQSLTRNILNCYDSRESDVSREDI